MTEPSPSTASLVDRIRHDLRAVLTAWSGLALCFAAPFVDDRPGLHLPLEPLLLVPFLVSLSRLKPKWTEEAGD